MGRRTGVRVPERDLNELTRRLGIRYPIFCGAMYPCCNPELVAAASEAGALGIVQPLSLTYVYGLDFREGLRHIRSLTEKPIGLNLHIEGSSKIYTDRMRRYLDVALEEGVRLFVTALGNPGWVVKRAHAAGVDGLICVNRLAGGHAGTHEPERLYKDLASLGKPLVCAGGVGDEETFRRILDIGYLGVQMGTRFIATCECKASEAYKNAILKARADDVVSTERLTGVPVAVLKTPHVQR